jgi:lysozyme
VGYALGEDRSDFQRGGLSWSVSAFGLTKFTEADNWKSATAPANWRTLAAEGKVRGAYHFLHPAISAVAQANYFVNYVRACGGWRPGDLFACDAEISIGEDGLETAAAPARARMHTQLYQAPERLLGISAGSAALQFCEAVAQVVGPSCPVLLYTYLGFLPQVADCAGFPLWVADYAVSPPADVSPWSRWTLWQNSDTGGQGGGDTDRFNGDETALLDWVGSFNWTEAMLSELPTVLPGAEDPINGSNYVHRIQALVAGIGQWNHLGAVTDIAQTGQYDVGVPADVIGPDQKAVRRVQEMFGLKQDGEVGPNTWRALILG